MEFHPPIGTKLISMTKITKNNVAAILQERGMSNITPTPDLLESLGINVTRFRRLINNEVKMNPLELRAFAKWLDVEPAKLIGNELQ